MKQSVASTVLAALTVASILVRAQGHTSTRDGVYTEEQATRGQASYKTACASCHQETLQGKGAQTPPLVGQEFLANWQGQPLGELFDRIQSSMPADKPATLSRTVNGDILAYLLKVNKLPAGKVELPVDAAALKQIQFDAPQ